ncbi:hypothetical protein RFI_31890 [Reticulomyxa filosa]|uniref:Uncharacterized protein n=1 Tax=Reticulomyxa filosa TaxID=46433 RepID=X6LVW6_RETFI|nr:hypothetical protein RFI_31890 [Reticulomyxa filosa]|eukprot:ETO05506.1 hypothetical protein RFI_31890 [Reticulomyxa filosa]
MKKKNEKKKNQKKMLEKEKKKIKKKKNEEKISEKKRKIKKIKKVWKKKKNWRCALALFKECDAVLDKETTFVILYFCVGQLWRPEHFYYFI